MIKFEGDVSVDVTLKANSTKIAPYNTLSTAQKWREELNKGDIVDVFDKYKTW